MRREIILKQMIAILVIPSADSSGRQLASFCRELSQPARGSVDTEYFQVDTDTDTDILQDTPHILLRVPPE